MFINAGVISRGAKEKAEKRAAGKTVVSHRGDATQPDVAENIGFVCRGLMGIYSARGWGEVEGRLILCSEPGMIFFNCAPTVFSIATEGDRKKCKQ